MSGSRRLPLLLRGMVLLGVVLSLVLLAASLRPASSYLRHWRLRQEVPLTEGISMRVEDLYLYPTPTTDLLRVRCRWLGGNPCANYWLRATIRTTPEGPEINKNIMWLVAVPKSTQDGETTPFCWEFRDAPKTAKRIYLRVYFRPKNATAGSEEKSIALDFANIPRLTPHGETPVIALK